MILMLAFEHQSPLKFTIEHCINHKQEFIDVLVEQHHNETITSVHVKLTNIGSCLNFDSKCHHRYKTDVINTFKINSYWANLQLK